MYILAMIVHVVVCIFLIIVVLLQSGKAADLAGAFGGMGSQTAFGPRGSATLLSKATTISAVVFMVTSLSLSILATRSAGSGTTVLEDQAPTNGSGDRRSRLQRRLPRRRSTGSGSSGPHRRSGPGSPGRSSTATCGGGGIGRRTSLRC